MRTIKDELPELEKQRIAETEPAYFIYSYEYYICTAMEILTEIYKKM